MADPAQDPEAHRMLSEQQEPDEAIAGLARGLEQMARGEGGPAAQAFAEFRARNDLPTGK